MAAVATVAAAVTPPPLSGGAQVVLLLGAMALGAALLWTAVVALWDWRQSKVDLIALEERVQAKRRKDPSYLVEGLTDAELEALRTSRLWGRRRPGPGRGRL